MAAELARDNVTVIVTSGGNVSPLAAKAATARTIPIIFAFVSDPVGSGLVTNFPHPGGNVTG